MARWLSRQEFLEKLAREDETTVEDVATRYRLIHHPCRDPKCDGWKVATPPPSLF